MFLHRFEKYQIIVADPPWWYADQRKIRKDGKTPTRGIGACHHYSQMTTDEICSIPVSSLAADRCHLYLWATCPLLPDALQVMDAWGFRWATVAFVWIKTNSGKWQEAKQQVFQSDFVNPSDDAVRKFLDGLTFFGPGFYTGSNIELVLLGTKGRPFRHVEGQKPSQAIYAPRGEHSSKPEVVQDHIEAMHSDCGPYLEMFARRLRVGWTVFGNEVEDLDFPLSL